LGFLFEFEGFGLGEYGFVAIGVGAFDNIDGRFLEMCTQLNEFKLALWKVWFPCFICIDIG
jgi:hypothetical protein